MWALVQSVPFNLAPATETIEGIVYKEPIPIANKVSFKNNEPHHSNHCLCYSCVPLPLLFKPTSAVYLENCKQAHQATYSNPSLKGKDLLKKTNSGTWILLASPSSVQLLSKAKFTKLQQISWNNLTSLPLVSLCFSSTTVCLDSQHFHSSSETH